MQKVRCAVIGVGYLGNFHAQKLAACPESVLVGVCDILKERCDPVASALQVAAFYDHRQLLDKVDAVCIAATTAQHYALAKDFLLHKKHVLIEKPMTETVEQARELIRIAKENNVKLQVGHLERFNAARIALDLYLDCPCFIESNRLAPFNPRGTDVGVVLDLMIHDIDLIQTIVKSPIAHMDAQGAPILSQYIDIANARITFQNGCVANVTASRVSFKTERKSRIFQPNSYISIDYQNKKFAVFKKGTKEMFPGIPEITRHESIFENSDALMEESKAFLQCIVHDTPPIVTGEEGLYALETATEITQLIGANFQKMQQIVDRRG